MKAYTKEEISQIVKKTREVSSDPYCLFVAYTLYAIFEYLDDCKEFSNEEDHYDEYWEMSANYSELMDIVDTAINDFSEAVDNHLQIDINGSSYTIRNGHLIDKNKLSFVFSFHTSPDNPDTQIRQRYIMNVCQSEKTFNDKRNELKENKSYFYKIVYVADKLGKYDQLTDIEAAVYCFGLYYSKNVSDDIGKRYMLKFMEKYQEYFLLDIDSVCSCLTDGLIYPEYYYSFSAKKIVQFNQQIGQTSIIGKINSVDAENYWHSVAVQHRFCER